MVAKGRQGSPMVAKGFQGPRGTPGMGEMSYNQTTWYSKSGHFPIEIPDKNKKWVQTLKIESWAPYTHWHAVLKGQVILRQKA